MRTKIKDVFARNAKAAVAIATPLLGELALQLVDLFSDQINGTITTLVTAVVVWAVPNKPRA